MRSGALLDRRLLRHATAIFALLVAATQAEAACTPAATSAPPLPPGTAVTCSGITTNQSGTNGYGTVSQTGLVIDVQNAASVTGTLNGLHFSDAVVSNGAVITGGSDGINSMTGFASITNSGSIFGTTGTGVRMERDLALLNNATGIIGGAINGVSVFARTANVTNFELK
jgi:hypothetical protein